MRRLRRNQSSGGSPPSWGLFPLALILLLLVLAPMIAHGQAADTAVVRWTAPGDDAHIGTAQLYDLRVSESPINSENFTTATAVTGLPAPLVAGTRQSATVRGLTRGTVYYFAIRAQDDAGNWSPISNLARWDWIFDAAPPGTPTGLTAAREVDAVRVRWNPSPEPDLAGYRVYRAFSSSGPFELISGGSIAETEWVSPIPDGAAVLWYEVSAVDVSGNESGRSARASLALTTTDAVVEVKVEGSYPNPSRIGSPVTIPVVVPASGITDAAVEILDSGNRRVRRIVLGNIAAGRQDLTWDGKNDSGQNCAPGVYRGWLHSNQGRQAIRVVRVP